MSSLRKVPDGGRLLPRRIFLQKPIGKFVLQLLVYYKGECKWETKQIGELIDGLTNKSM